MPSERTILEICQDAAERAGLAAPGKIFGSNDKRARRLRVAATDTMREMSRFGDSEGWSDLRSEWIFTITPGNFSYPLPQDFLRIVPGTMQRENWPLGVLGPTNPITWALWRNGVTRPYSPYGWRVANGRLFLEPPGETNEILRWEYQSKYLVVRDATLADYIQMPSPDEQSFYIPKVGIVPIEGELSVPPSHITEVSGKSYTGGWEVGTWENDKWDGLLGLYYGCFRREAPLQNSRVRAPNFTADTDRPAFSCEDVISLGITWRVLRSLNKPYAEEMREFMEAMRFCRAVDGAGPSEIKLGDYHEGREAYPLVNGDKWVIS